MVTSFAYYTRRFLAIALGLVLTGYSAWASWSHSHDLIGPLAAIAAASMLVFAEYALRDRQWVYFTGLSVLGLAAAIISGSAVLERVSHSHEARTHEARSANLPRIEASKALAEATAALKTVQAEASAACGSGRGPICKGQEKREEDARKRVADARSKLVALGAEVSIDPVGGILGGYTEMFRLTTLLGLPIWLEMAAPIVLAYGFAPAPRKEAPTTVKAVRRKEKRVRRKPAAQDGVTDWVEAYRQKHGHAPKVADVRQAFGVSKTTAWRRLRSSS